ncbi:MAG: hypothetical protein JXB19_07775 [Bacteroidales bacterium]|nr:hypothetical protein [Bacteroidales bacterium]
MKRLILICLPCVFFFTAYGQEQTPVAQNSGIDRNNLVIRQNSRDYAIVRKGNNHERMLQIRAEVMMRQSQAIINRKMAMERRRQIIQQRMIRQQQIRQRMIRQRNPHR